MRSPSNISKCVTFKEPEACVDYTSYGRGWDIISYCSPCSVSHKLCSSTRTSSVYKCLSPYVGRYRKKMFQNQKTCPCTTTLLESSSKLHRLRMLSHVHSSSKWLGWLMTSIFRFPWEKQNTVWQKQVVSFTQTVNIFPQHMWYLFIGTTESPTLKDLIHLTAGEGKDIHIIEESAINYRQIGTILLDDERGNKVDSIEHDTGGKAEEAITEIYKKWMKEDPNYSWVKLTQCFRKCSLNSLASDIEQHFGIPPPPESRAGTVFVCLEVC